MLGPTWALGETVTVVLDKVQQRLERLSRRSCLTPAELADADARLPGALTGLVRGRTAAYASVGREPGTRALLASLLASAGGVLLPVLLPDGDLDWAAYDGELRTGPLGLLEPPGPRLGRDAVGDCALVVVPALAVDRRGTRLGRGGGSYDRALVRARGLVVAPLHDGELVDALPAEPHDRPVDAVVLPAEGLVRLRPERSA